MITKPKAAVVGFPVKHSLSPKIHGYWLEKYGIAGEYGLLEVTEDQFVSVLRGLPAGGYRGVNITVPHKETALATVDEVSPEARMIGAVNTVVVQEGGKLLGHNTDAYGFIQNIRMSKPDFDFTKGPAVVLGAGGAARAVVYGLVQQGVPKVILMNRTRNRAEKLQKDMASDRVVVEDWEKREEVLSGANLLINTTVLGMTGQEPLEIRLDALSGEALVTDIVYKPLQTALLAQAEAHGNLTVDGLGMLLYQAVQGFEMWFGKRPEVTEELRKKVLGI